MASAANAAVSDGVVYKFFVWEKGDDSRQGLVSSSVNVTSAVATP